jgi:hypothetical protein
MHIYLTRFNQWFSKKIPNRTQRLTLVTFVASFIILGIAYLALSTADVLSSNSEVEDGTVVSPAQVVNDNNASSNKAVQFVPNTDTTPPGGTVAVRTATELTNALAAAKPGDVIVMADGTYSGHFVSTASGTANAPITLKGGRNAVLDGGTIKSGYTFQLGTKNSPATISYWKLDGFTVIGGQKGIIFDNVQHGSINNLYVHNIGEEGIHLRDNSSDNVVSGNTIAYTGQDTQAYGEGIYVGSAVSNWDTYSQNQPDHSNRNQIINNTISNTGAENMDIKEGTHAGIIRGNRFDGTGMCWDIGADCNFGDSMIDMKGEGWIIDGNTLAHMHAVWKKGGQTNDGIQVHVISGAESEGSGNNNSFTGNAISDVGGYGFNVQKTATGVIVKCSNTVTGAGQGFGNIVCTQ